MRNFAAFFGLLAALGASACASSGTEPVQAPAPDSQAVVVVTNNNWSDMVVYVRVGAQRQRLGMVPSMRQERLRIPRALLPDASRVQLEAHPIGGLRNYLSDPVVLNRGGQLEWRIEATPSLSSLVLR